MWFDAMTHVLQMGGVGDYRYYDEYDLWGGARGDLSTAALRSEHVRKVFAVQTSVGSNHLGPTALLHTGLSENSVLSLELAREAIHQDPETWLTIAGSASFWASGRALDAHVGALAALQPAGWFLCVGRPIPGVPVAADAEEIHGLCRTARALSENAPVHVSHGDLAALPAVAAGAFSVGTGWDQRQRSCAYTDYGERAEGGGGGAWYQRPTLRRLLGSLTGNEAAILQSRDAARVAALGGLPAPGPKEAFLHHALVLATVVNDVYGQATYPDRFARLSLLYQDALAEWPTVERIASVTLGHEQWIDPFERGLALYGVSEGY
jgi:hypothetical protein